MGNLDINEVLENVGVKDKKDEIVTKLGSKVGLDEATSKQIGDTATDLLNDNVVSKIKLPF